MERNIKLLWDFRGPAAAKTAAHHEIHLRDFIASQKLDLPITGHSSLSEMHAIAFMVVPEGSMRSIRDALRPHRAEIYNNPSQ
ncbi:MAG: hypothetical protein MUO53_17945 [Maribacter sp.]|nr:hypothetical protein [Maribacter sp.]